MAYVKKADRAKLEMEAKEQGGKTTQPTEAVAPVKVKRDWSRKGKLDVPVEYHKKYPGMHPVWVRRDSDSMEEKEGEGYEYPTLTKDERKSRGPLSQGSSETSFITRGDLILMHISEEDFKDKFAAEIAPIQNRQRYIAESAERNNKLRGVTADTSETLEDK